MIPIRSIFTAIIALLPIQVAAQPDQIAGRFGIKKSERLLYQGDSVTAVYQPEIVFIEDYHNTWKGLPDSLYGIPDGKYVLFNAPETDEDLYLRETGFYINSMKDSICKVFYKNGQIQEIRTYRYGRLNGRQTRWDSEGRIIRDFSLVNGNLHGPATFIATESIYIGTGAFDSGQYVGKWTYTCYLCQDTGLKIEKYHSGLGKYRYAEKFYQNDSLITEVFRTKRYDLVYEGGVRIDCINLKQEERKNRKLTETKTGTKKPKMYQLKRLKFESNLIHIDTVNNRELDRLIRKFKSNKSHHLGLLFHITTAHSQESPWIDETIRYLNKGGTPSGRIVAGYTNTDPSGRIKKPYLKWYMIGK